MTPDEADVIKIKDEQDDGDLVLEVIKHEQSEQNEDKYTTNCDQSQRDGTPPGDGFDASRDGTSSTAAHTNDAPKVSLIVSRVFM